MKKLITLAAIAALSLGLLALPAEADTYPAPHLVKDIAEGTDQSFVEQPGATLGSSMIFAAEDDEHSLEPWITDGTEVGTRLLKDVQPGGGVGDPQHFTTYDGRVYFTANGYVGSDKGVELWATDGTEAGTQMVLDINLGAGSSNPHDLVVTGGKLWFTAAPTGTTEQLYSFAGPGSPLTKMTSFTGASTEINQITPFGSKVVFSTNANGWGHEPWISNGTTSGTYLVKNLNAQGSGGSDGSAPSEFTVLGSSVLFRATDGLSGQELWKTNGDPNNTTLVKDLNAAPAGSEPHELHAFGDVVLFQATGTAGNFVWATDGTSAGTTFLAQARGGDNDGGTAGWTDYDGWAYFSATGAGGHSELWRTQGTVSSTSQFAKLSVGGDDAAVRNFRVVDDQLFFSAQDGSQNTQLWRTDGTVAGTVKLQDVLPHPAVRMRQVIGSAGNTLFFTATDPVHGYELWAHTTRVASPPVAVVHASTTKVTVKKSFSKRTAAKKKITVTVKVRAAGVVPTGKVVLKRGSKVVGKGTLRKGAVKIRVTRKLGRGTTKLRAYYTGDAVSTPSRSGTIKVRVK